MNLIFHGPQQICCNPQGICTFVVYLTHYAFLTNIVNHICSVIWPKGGMWHTFLLGNLSIEPKTIHKTVSNMWELVFVFVDLDAWPHHHIVVFTRNMGKFWDQKSQPMEEREF